MRNVPVIPGIGGIPPPGVGVKVPSKDSVVPTEPIVSMVKSNKSPVTPEGIKSLERVQLLVLIGVKTKFSKQNIQQKDNFTM